MTDLHYLDHLPTAPLSPTLAQKRDELRTSLVRRVTTRRRRRATLRAGAGLAVLSLLSWWAWPRDAHDAPPRSALPPLANCRFEVIGPSAPELAQLAHVALAPCSAAVPSDWLVTDRAPPDWSVDDQALLELLAAAERPTGLVRVGGEVAFPDLAFDSWRTLQD